MKSRLGFMASLGTALVVAACGQATPTAAPATPTPIPSPAPAVAKAAMLYQQTCSACHGLDAEGTAIAPAIAGHSISGLKAQVRNPLGTMPTFTSAMLGDGDLNEIAAYVASLGPASSPMMEWEMAASETIHLWMALVSLKTDDPADARHHLEDAIAFVNDPAWVAEMEKALNLISAGNIHDAEHEIEEVAGAAAPSEIAMQRFHLILAQRAIEDDDAAAAEHHLEHFLAAATEEQEPVVMEALELIERGDLHEAEHEVEELLEMAS